MFAHVSIGVKELARASIFYDAVLQPLGYVRLLSEAGEGTDHPWPSAGYGPAGTDLSNTNGDCPFWLEQRADAGAPDLPGFHICFAAPTRAAVRAFHIAGLAHGARDYGAPGLRPHYGPDYYAAFLIDPDGWRIEAVSFSRP